MSAAGKQHLRVDVHSQEEEEESLYSLQLKLFASYNNEVETTERKDDKKMVKTGGGGGGGG